MSSNTTDKWTAIDPQSAKLLNSSRPSKIEFFSCLAYLGSVKPDRVAQVAELSNTLKVQAKFLGNCGCCLVDADGRVRTVEGSGNQHVLLDLAHSGLLKHAVAFVTHVPCSTCCVVAASSGLAKLVVAHKDKDALRDVEPPISSDEKFTWDLEKCTNLMSQQPVALSLYKVDQTALCWTAYRQYCEIQKARAEMEKAHAEMEKAHAQMEKAHAQMEKAHAEMEKAHAEMEKARAEMEKAHAEMEKARAEMEKARAEMEKWCAHESQQEAEKTPLEAYWAMACSAAASCRAEFFSSVGVRLSFMGSTTVSRSSDGKEFRVLGVGYNGFPAGCTVKDAEGFVTLHSESNALRFAASARGGKNAIYCTHEPCDACARQIFASLGDNTEVFFTVPVEEYGFVRKLFAPTHLNFNVEWVLLGRAWPHTEETLQDLAASDALSTFVQTGLQILGRLHSLYFNDENYSKRYSEHLNKFFKGVPKWQDVNKDFADVKCLSNFWDTVLALDQSFKQKVADQVLLIHENSRRNKRSSTRVADFLKQYKNKHNLNVLLAE